MKRPRKSKPTRPQVRKHIEDLIKGHQIEWRNELLTTTVPEWTHLLCLHLRMVELAQLEAGMKELF